MYKKNKTKKERHKEKIDLEIKKFLVKEKKIEKKRKLSNAKYYIYYLINPINKKVFYVGKGSGNRMYDHVKQVKDNIMPNNNPYLFEEIKYILSKGKEVIHKKVWFSFKEDQAYFMEKKFIEKFGLKNLTNIEVGGLSKKKRKKKRKFILNHKNYL